MHAYEHFKEEINCFTSTNTYLHDSVHANLKAFIVVDLMFGVTLMQEVGMHPKQRKDLHRKSFIVKVLQQLTKLVLSLIRATQEERALREKKDCKCVDLVQSNVVCWLL